jgi:hypothetical protein
MLNCLRRTGRRRDNEQNSCASEHSEIIRARAEMNYAAAGTSSTFSQPVSRASKCR